jgi:cytochrome c oxidase subunit 2
MQGVPILKLAVASIVLGAVISVLMLIPDWNGTAASTAAPKIDTLLDVSIVLSSFVFSVVVVMLGYSIWKWRAKPGDESDGEPIHGNTKLEIVWTAIPTAIVLFLAVYAWVVLDKIEAKEPDQLPIKVTAQQYEWDFDYTDQGVTSKELHVPVDRQLELTLRSLDVIHSFWVPEWRIKRDLVPGSPGSEIDDTVVITPDKAGTYSVICTELCGFGHSTMRASVVVESEADFEAWVAKQQPIQEPSQPDQGDSGA